MSNSLLFESEVDGANPAPATSFGTSSFDPPGGEIESRLAYTQKSRGQSLLGRPLPRCIIRSAPVSDTGRWPCAGTLERNQARQPVSILQQRANTSLRE